MSRDSDEKTRKDNRNAYMKEYMREYYKNHKLKLKKDDKELNKDNIPVEDRCEDFDELWDKIYNEVVWNWRVVKDIKEIN